MQQNQAKKSAAQKSMEFVVDGMIIGLGTGTTANYAIKILAKKVKEGLRIKVVSSSQKTKKLAQKLDLEITEDYSNIDLTIDGADKIDVNGNLIKGKGGAMVQEKLLALSSKKVIIIVDKSKLCDAFENVTIPVEILPYMYLETQKRISKLCGKTQVRKTKSGKLYLSDNKNYILDCDFSIVKEPAKLEKELKIIHGVVDCGIFINLAHVVIVGD